MTEVAILDYQEGVITWGGDEETFQNILNSFDEQYFNPSALNLHKGIMKIDFEEIRICSYRLKGPALYVNTKKLYNLTAELQRKGAAKEPMSSILKDYMKFLDLARELKKEIARILKRPVSLNIADFDVFEKQVTAAFPDYFKAIKIGNSNEIMNPVCQGCNIF